MKTELMEFAVIQPSSGLWLSWDETRGSSFVATAGLNDETPLAFLWTAAKTGRIPRRKVVKVA